MSEVELHISEFKEYNASQDPYHDILTGYAEKCAALKPGERIEIKDHAEISAKKGLIANSLWNILKYRYGIDTDIDEEVENKDSEELSHENGRISKKVYIVRK